MDRETIEQMKQASNIWAMIAAGGFIAACFQGQLIWGLILALFSVHMSLKLTGMWVRAEKRSKEWHK